MFDRKLFKKMLEPFRILWKIVVSSHTSKHAIEGPIEPGLLMIAEGLARPSGREEPGEFGTEHLPLASNGIFFLKVNSHQSQDLHPQQT